MTGDRTPGSASPGAGAGAFLAVAERLAAAAAAIVMKYFRSDLAVDQKTDLSPVTGADREAEAAMRAIIRDAFPDHGVYGEEGGKDRVGAEYVWVLDPIDGTQSFVTGKPLFGTLIGLARDGVPVLGIMDAPALKERWVGIEGRPTTFNGAPVRVRACAKLGDAWLYATSPHMFPGPEFEAFERLRGRVRRAVYGAECYAYGLLANGHVDLVVEATMQPYDFMALAPIVAGAGGVISDWRGNPLTLESGEQVLAAGDGRIHAGALEILGA